jgi:mannose-6-phosphate isomerase-like protein (cupin superfamily)
MKHVHVHQATTKPNPHGVDARMLYDRESAQAVHLRLEPGQALRRHITPVDVFFFVIEGEGVVEVGDEQLEVSPDMLVESPADIPHRILNPSEAPLRVLVVKAPRPTKATRLL